MKLPLPTLYRAFRFEITVEEGDKTFTLPLGEGTHNFTINWGDGSSNKITAYDDENRVHTYDTAGTYIIAMRGTCTNFVFNNEGDKLKLNKLLGFIDMGFTILNFHGCENLTKIHPSMRVLRSLTTASQMFMRCGSLTSIPAGIFDGAVNVNDFGYTFFECDGLTSIPTGLFDNNIAVTTFDYCFKYCYSLNTIPSGLFDNNTGVTNFDSTFSDCTGLTTIPSGLFDNNILVTNFDYTFYKCDGLTSIPTGLFDNNIAVTNFEHTFRACTGLTTIPSGLFDNNILVTNFESCFRGCSNMDQVLDGNIFLYNDKVDDFRNTFKDCSKLTGLGWQTIISNAEAQETPPTYTDDCFLGAEALTDYESIPEAWK